MTKALASKAVKTSAVAAGFLLFAGGAAGAAHASPDQVSAGNQGIGNGTQVLAPIQVPVDICGNAVAVAGVSGAGCQGGSSADLDLGDDDDWADQGESGSQRVTPEAAEDGGLGDQASVGNNGILNGTQAEVPIQVPVDICGNAVAVAGVSGAGCQGGSSADLGESDDMYETEGAVSDVAGKVLPGGSQLPAGQTVDGLAGQLPAGDTVSGVVPSESTESGLPGGELISGLTGGGLPTDGLTGGELPTDKLAGINNGAPQGQQTGQMPAQQQSNGSQAQAEDTPAGGLAPGQTLGQVTGALPTKGLLDVQPKDNPAPQEHAGAADLEGNGGSEGGEGGGDQTSAGNQGILNGTQVELPVQVPVDLSGNSIAVLGAAGAGSQGGSSADLDY